MYIENLQRAEHDRFQRQKSHDREEAKGTSRVVLF